MLVTFRMLDLVVRPWCVSGMCKERTVWEIEKLSRDRMAGTSSSLLVDEVALSSSAEQSEKDDILVVDEFVIGPRLAARSASADTARKKVPCSRHMVSAQVLV